MSTPEQKSDRVVLRFFDIYGTTVGHITYENERFTTDNPTLQGFVDDFFQTGSPYKAGDFINRYSHYAGGYLNSQRVESADPPVQDEPDVV